MQILHVFPSDLDGFIPKAKIASTEEDGKILRLLEVHTNIQCSPPRSVFVVSANGEWQSFTDLPSAIAKYNEYTIAD